MNDQTQSMIRAVFKIGGGYLVAKGLASDNEVEAIGAGLFALLAVVWGYFHRSSGSQAKAPGLNAPLMMLVAFLLLAGSVAGIVTLTGCQAPAQRVAFNAVSAPTTTAQQALTVWDDYVKQQAEQGAPVQIEKQKAVKDAYEKYQACALLEWDAAHAYAQSVGTTNSAAALLRSQLANGNAGQALADLLNLLKSFGLKI